MRAGPSGPPEPGPVHGPWAEPASETSRLARPGPYPRDTRGGPDAPDYRAAPEAPDAPDAPTAPAALDAPGTLDALGAHDAVGARDALSARDAPADRSARQARRGQHVSGTRVVRRPWAAIAAIAGTAALCAGVGGLAWASHTGHKARPATANGPVPLTAVPRGKWAAAPEATAAAVARPASLSIPAIGVRTQLIRLGLTSTGELQVPPTAAVAGWYTGSVRPGQIGAAVIVGHIDSYSGPGIFYRLRLMRTGELVYVVRADGTLAVFRVNAVHSYLKTRFPTSIVYGAVPNAQLRLITCGGAFDPATGHYLSNIIVFATLQPGHEHLPGRTHPAGHHARRRHRPSR